MKKSIPILRYFFNFFHYYSIPQVIPIQYNSNSLHKGECGRIGVIGGCVEYTGMQILKIK
jgi:NAD(P)H-hydrate repair Nnr-like enzyme with NAD(P)H-hydrate dehydratase domain